MLYFFFYGCWTLNQKPFCFYQYTESEKFVTEADKWAHSLYSSIGGIFQLFVQFGNLKNNCFSWNVGKQRLWHGLRCDFSVLRTALSFKSLLLPINWRRFLFFLPTTIGFSSNMCLWLGLITSKCQCLLTIYFMFGRVLLNVNTRGIRFVLVLLGLG